MKRAEPAVGQLALGLTLALVAPGVSGFLYSKSKTWRGFPSPELNKGIKVPLKAWEKYLLYKKEQEWRVWGFPWCLHNQEQRDGSSTGTELGAQEQVTRTATARRGCSAAGSWLRSLDELLLQLFIPTCTSLFLFCSLLALPLRGRMKTIHSRRPLALFEKSEKTRWEAWRGAQLPPDHRVGRQKGTLCLFSLNPNVF